MAKNLRILHIAAALLLACSLSSLGQKKITPVDKDPTRPPQPVLHYYDKHGEPLEEPVLFLADLDTVKKVSPGPVYPLWQSVSIGANFFDGIMKLAGQSYASFDIWGELSLHNWVQPVVAFGVGYADSQPEEGNFRYKGKPSFYAKIGANYNFLYKSNPDYQFHFGLRCGYSNFRYDITDITINSSYWGQSNNFSILNQKAHALYGEVLGGLKVKLWKNISMGWDICYRFKWKVSNGVNSTPWFIPGYGAGSALSATFSLIYTIPIGKGKKEKAIGEDATAAPLPETDELPTRDTLPVREKSDTIPAGGN